MQIVEFNEQQCQLCLQTQNGFKFKSHIEKLVWAKHQDLMEQVLVQIAKVKATLTQLLILSRQQAAYILIMEVLAQIQVTMQIGIRTLK